MNPTHPEIAFAIVAATIVFLLLSSSVVIYGWIYEKRKKQHSQEMTTLKLIYDKNILQTQLEIQEQTLKNISQEIHDNIGQVLSLAKLNINTMCDATPQVLQEKITDSKQLISKAIQDLRDLSRSLNTDYIVEMGLIRSVEYELELISKTGSFKTHFGFKGQPYRLDQQQELILFRIVQEALHNIIKHAMATDIYVQIEFEPETFILTINDNGVGFDTSRLEESNYAGSGMGIRNMRNRAKLINAGFELKSTREKGTAIVLTLQH